MKKLFLYVFLVLLWGNVGLAKDFYEIEKFKCKYNKSAVGGYHDFGGTQEKKIYTSGVHDIATWNIKISNINHKERTAYLILLDDVVRNIHIINPQKEFGVGKFINFLWLKNYGETTIITIFGSKTKNGNYFSTESTHSTVIYPSAVQYYGFCWEN